MNSFVEVYNMSRKAFIFFKKTSAYVFNVECKTILITARSILGSTVCCDVSESQRDATQIFLL